MIENKFSPLARAPRQSGFTMLEILVAVLILAFGILGMATLQLNALKLNQTSAARTQASFLAADLADRLRANREAARDGDYDIAIGASAPSGSSLSAVDLRNWKNRLSGTLPEGDGSVSRNGSLVTITVQWSEAKVDGSESQQFVFVTGL